MTVKIILAGPRGKMGSEALRMIHSEEKFQLVACIDKPNSELPDFLLQQKFRFIPMRHNVLLK